ncbi:MAG: phosphoribosyltransferase domain-containing protein [Nitrosopumilus sp.]|nr:phosphoribosyltransferase domain-containing protein [Nitrosopumilus sp.]MDH3515488.1 phosphoribosyltransferase domain-containing protein [Nitrosopumilus sp.]MDH3565555.1 phosphoribosyltransferase domain-containing protein [Nitrosopumilus sp.]MDH5416747.1 phosphoribosyltransferase domain-containing protein [Nitrosopumilus sp.]MDH5555211.1 phosphoribosyltransferase domain-containing protein [Nitrosopumilus sp.]
MFVDDIFDTGDTFTKILSRVDNPSKLTFVALFARHGKIFPKQLVYEKNKSTGGYVVFPWDILEFQRSKKYCF